MIWTEQQRRWWFATHPQYSSSRRRHSNKDHSNGAFSRESSGLPAASRDSYQIYEDVLDRINGYQESRQALESDPHTFLDVMPFRRLVTSPIGYLKGLLRRQARDAVVYATKKGIDEGPGKWVEVGRRGGPSLMHQSRMSGQPIQKIGDKHRINEYEYNGVKFDDYKNGKLYEYKGSLEFLFDKHHEMKPWVKDRDQFYNQGLRQVEAAQGIPVIWKVGASLLEGLRKAVGKIPGVSIEP